MNLTTEQLKAFKLAYPERFTKLEAEAKRMVDEKAQEIRERTEREVRERFERKLGHEKFRVALVSQELPDFGFLRGVHGLLAQRAWVLTEAGGLRSTAMSTVWKQIMIADHLPLESNQFGLYCNAIDPTGMMISSFKYLDNRAVQGVVECRGKVVRHSDGVMRVEWARILCLIILAGDAYAYSSNFGLMRDRYFPVPVFVLTFEQYAEFLFRLMVVNRSRGVEK